MDNITEQFSLLLKKENKKELIPLLRSLNAAQKKELLPGLKKLEKEYSEWKETNGSYRRIATQQQLEILAIAAFVCYNRKDFEKGFHGGILENGLINDMLTWHCPDWFGDYINNFANAGYVPYYISYEWYNELVEKGFVPENAQLIAQLLPRCIFHRTGNKEEIKTDNLLNNTITLKEHIWYLFEHENNIPWNDKHPSQTNNNDGIWTEIFKQYVLEERIERQRLLRESVLAANKGFNQTLSGWYISLFAALKPLEPELLILQHDMMSVLNSPNTKPVNTALQFFKEIVSNDAFDVDTFLDHIALIISSDAKSIVTSTLMLLERLAKKHPEKRKDICIKASQALIHQDSALQLRTAKIIDKYGDEHWTDLKTAVDEYNTLILSETRLLLNKFLSGQEEIILQNEEEDHPATEELEKIIVPVEFEDFLFLASQAFDQNKPYHFDVLAATVLKFHSRLTTHQLIKLMPAFQRAYKIVTTDWTSTKGFLDDMLAEFFISWGRLLTPSAELDISELNIMHKMYEEQEKSKKEKWVHYIIRLTGIKSWQAHSQCFSVPKNLLQTAIWLVENKKDLPLLSTPTHAPCFINIIAIIDRLAIYAKQHVVPGNTDIQVAISRCFTGNKTEALIYARQKLDGEYKNLIELILGEDYQAPANTKIKNAWLVAAGISSYRNTDWRSNLTQLSEQYLNADFSWNTHVEQYMRPEYDPKKQKMVNVPATRKTLKIEFGNKKKPENKSLFKNLLGKVLPAKTAEEEDSIYNYMELNSKFISAEPNDIARLLYLSPEQPGLLLAQIINKSLAYPEFWEGGDKKMVIATLEALFWLPKINEKMFYLFLATCMICGDKTARSYAAELWIKGVREGTIDSALIGEIIGAHQQIEFAPLKRFTDLIQSNMYGISAKHNKALQALLISYIANTGEIPINNTKKMLETIVELLLQNKSKINDRKVITKLTNWKNTASLTKIVEKIPLED